MEVRVYRMFLAFQNFAQLIILVQALSNLVQINVVELENVFFQIIVDHQFQDVMQKTTIAMHIVSVIIGAMVLIVHYL
jgi:hypothetical protein